MAFKTLSLDVEAYELLARAKRPGQSFSQVVKEHFDRRSTGRDLLAAIEKLDLQASSLEAVDQVVAERPLDRVRDPGR